MSHSTQLTLRGFDPRLSRAIRDLARRDGISLNKAALRLMEKGAGLGVPRADERLQHSLDHLIGTWSQADADELLGSIKSCEQVDEDLWR